MSKIYEALENAEKDRVAGLNKKSSLPVEPEEEKKVPVAPAPNEEKRIPISLEPKEEKKPALVAGPNPAPAPAAPKEEKKTPPIVGPSSTAPSVAKEKKATFFLRRRSARILAAKKEKKRTVPVLEPREERKEKHQVVHPPKTASKPVRWDRMEMDHPLVTLSQPGSLGAEQFRKLRAQILRLNIPDPPKTIMVTSATEGEGKTFVAANLAAGIAHDLHLHALLVDCDLRSPSLSNWFGVENGHGLSDYLVGGGNLSEFLIKTEMDKLIILTGGSAQEKPAELIGSKKMASLIQELKSRYDDRYIILDATPLLATTEPELLARLVDGVLVVVRAGVTPRETVKQAIASLDPKKILGFVLNDVEFKSSGLFSRYFGSGGYYARYGYGYGHGKRGAEPQSSSGGVTPLKKRSDG